jgi:succinate-semialdehyde dehydrogenase/glutarate-semialdehyde dehydrogenase
MLNPESTQTVGERDIVTYPLLIDGKEVSGDSATTVYDKFTAQPIAHFANASRSQVAQAVAAAAAAFKTHPLAPYDRYTILQRTAELVQQQAVELIESIVAESGFTVSDAKTELNRSVQTLILSAEEAKRIHGEMVPLESAPNIRNRIGFTIRVPVGVVCAITPFNSPLNTVTHKVAPALAAGNSVVLKPASATPITAALLCRLLIEAGLPHGYINLLNGSGRDIGRWLLEEEQIRFYTFTGSTEVGRAIQRGAGLRRTQLELGSISSTIVCDDANLEWTVPRCVNASFRKAGQVCTSVQRLLVHEQVLDQFVSSLVARTERAKVGDPRDPETLVGPMIDVREAERAEEWVKEAVAQGATIATGGRRDGALLQPTVLLNVTTKMRVVCDEVFAPIISIVPFRSLDEAIRQVNDTPYGLAAGLFTSNINTALMSARQLEVGTLHVNETSSSRVDLMPYGGVKDSGFGHEGPKYAIREMTEERLVTIACVS